MIGIDVSIGRPFDLASPAIDPSRILPKVTLSFDWVPGGGVPGSDWTLLEVCMGGPASWFKALMRSSTSTRRRTNAAIGASIK